MKTILVAIFCLSSSPATAEIINSQFVMNPKKGECYPTGSSGYSINQKLDSLHYGMTSKSSFMKRHAILKSQKQLKVGWLPENSVKYIKYLGTKKVLMENGFSETVDRWEACKAFE